MSRLMKCRKISEAENQETIDRISTLPDDVLGYMLSFLPTKCAVGTSVLSSRWRCLHMMTHCLSFDIPRGSRQLDSKSQKKSYKSFMNRVLLLHKVSPIEKFHLSCGGHSYDDSDYHAWISVALLKQVKQLHLSFNGQITALPHRLFTCQTVVDLNLDTYIEGFRVPESTHLPNHRILDVCRITFLDGDSLGKFFHACPLLHKLTINSCEWPKDSDCHLRLSSRALTHLTVIYCQERIEVDAPNLIYLEYFPAGLNVALSLKNSNSLVTAILEFPYTDDPASIKIAFALIKAVHRAKELELLDGVVQYLAHAKDDQIPSFSNLVKLYLGPCSYVTWKYVTHWLADLPRLEMLIFEEGLLLFASREEKWHPLLPFSSCVKVIEAHDIVGDATELVVLKHLLGNAKVLRRLTLYKDADYMTKKNELQSSWKLRTFLRASKTCVVQMKDHIRP